MTRVDFEAVTATGATVFTSSEEDIARSYVAARKHEFPGLIVERVTRTEVRERAYTSRLTLVRSA